MIVLAALTACLLQAPQRFEFSEVHMGVRVRIVTYVADAAMAERACRAAFAEFERLDAVMSDYREDSELMRLCGQAGGAPVVVSRDLFEVLRCARRVSQLSDGLFDVTVGPMVQLWRRSRKTKVLPSHEELSSAKRLTGWRKMHLDDRGLRVWLDTAGMRLDLGGIAKGYACEKAYQRLRDAGARMAMVEAGGDIRLGHAPPGQAGWIIALPDGTQATLANCGISTSGDTVQYVEIGGKRYSHVVDPRTGLGMATNTVACVTAKDAMTSDALSTAVHLLGAKRGADLISKFGGAKALYLR